MLQFHASWTKQGSVKHPTEFLPLAFVARADRLIVGRPRCRSEYLVLLYGHDQMIGVAG